MINSINTSPTFQGKAFVMHSGKPGAGIDFLNKLCRVATNMSKKISIIVADKGEKLPYNTLERNVEPNQIIIADSLPVPNSKDMINFVVIAKGRSSDLIKALKKFFDPQNVSEFVQPK